jgi:cell division protein FtsB
MFESSKALALANTENKTLKVENASLRKEINDLRVKLTRLGIEIAQDVMTKIDAVVMDNHTGAIAPTTKEEQ